MKKIISLAIVCVMMLGMLSMVSFAAPAAIGESTTTWEISGTTLTIGGTGAMPDFRGSEDSRPWVGSLETITKVVVEDGVTHVGSSAFTKMTAVTEINFGKGATSIGMDAFSYCTALEKVTFGAPVEKIGQGIVFGSSNITSVVLTNQTKEEFKKVATMPDENGNYTISYNFAFPDGSWAQSFDTAEFTTVTVSDETPDTPDTGDATVVAVVFATVAILGMAVVVTKKVNA